MRTCGGVASVGNRHGPYATAGPRPARGCFPAPEPWNRSWCPRTGRATNVAAEAGGTAGLLVAQGCGGIAAPAPWTQPDGEQKGGSRRARASRLKPGVPALDFR